MAPIESPQGSETLTPADELKLAKAKAIKACSEEIQATLERYGCVLRASPQFVPDHDGRFRLIVAVDCIPQ